MMKSPSAGLLCVIAAWLLATPLSADSGPEALADQSVLSVVCGATVELCQRIEGLYRESHDDDIQVARMSSGEVLSYLERQDDPAFDIWWGGTGDTHLRAADSGLLAPFEPNNLDQQLRWSRHFWRMSASQSVGVYAGTLVLVSNQGVLQTQNLSAPRCWSDLGDPNYRNAIIITDPSISGTSFLFLGTLMQIFGDARGERLLSEIRQNTQGEARSGFDALQRVVDGHNGITVAFAHDVIPMTSGRDDIEVYVPCEGAGYEIGAASIVRGTELPNRAVRFIEFTLSDTVQNDLISLPTHQMFSNVFASPSAVYEDLQFLNLINYDFVTYSNEFQRRRLIDLWHDK